VKALLSIALMNQKLVSIFFLSLVVLCQVGCAVESDLEDNAGFNEDGFDGGSDTQGDDPGQTLENVIVQRTINATSNDVWVYFDFDSASVVYPENPEDDSQWDIAFKRFKIKLNGGVSGTAGVEVSALNNTVMSSAETSPNQLFFSDRVLNDLSDSELLQLGDNLFFSVCESGYDDTEAANYCLANKKVNRNHLNAEEFAYAFLTQGSGEMIEGDGSDGGPILGWYDYYFSENHILRPANDIWLLRSSEGNEFFVDMLGYYGLNEGDAESGTLAFQYKSLSTDGGTPQLGDEQLILELSSDVISGSAPLAVNFMATVQGASGNVDWVWNFGDGFDADQRNTIEHVFDESGTFEVTVAITDQRNVTVQKTLSIIVTDNTEEPIADAGDDRSEVLGASPSINITLDGSLSRDMDGEIVSYVWEGSDGIDPEDIASPDIIISSGGVYTFILTVTDNDGYTATDTVIISVDLPIAVIKFEELAGLDSTREFSFDASDSDDANGFIVSWLWDFGDGNSSDDETPIYSYEEGGIYSVKLTVTDDSGLTNTAISVVVAASLEIPASEDTYVYEFLGNQSDPNGDSGGIKVWNHESSHGGKAVINFDSVWLSEEVLSGDFQALLYLYQVCELEGFVSSCAGSDSPVVTDLVLQDTSWSEGDSNFSWGDIAEAPKSSFSLTQSNANNAWVAVDISDLVQTWVAAGNTGFGIALSQEAYAVIRDDNGSVTVSSFCDSESSSGICGSDNFSPYIEIKVTP
jgi:PKD repeat protein